jgi:nicotinate dehydrogenase subunit B
LRRRGTFAASCSLGHDGWIKPDAHIVDRPGLPFRGAGEAGQDPAAAAIANAIADATGQRLRDLPLTAAKLKAAVGI